MVRKGWPFWLGGFLIAWLFDFFFWQKAPGISIFIWIVLVIAVGVSVLLREKVKPAWQNILLIIFTIGMAFVTFLRDEPFTRLFAFCISFAFLFLLTFSYQKGYWIFYRIRDYVVAFFQMSMGMLSRGIGLLGLSRTIDPKMESDSGAGKARRKPKKVLGSILLGIVITIPVLAIMMALLSSADLVFANHLSKIIQSFHLENLPEWIFRLGYIIVLTFIIVGVWLHAGFPKKPESIPDPKNDKLKPFLGWIVTLIPLISIVILFIFFVAFQFHYLFGAQSNISVEGFTYAEYARRGFFELVAVAILSLIIYVVLSAATRWEKPFQKSIFSIFVIVLVALVLVILWSAFQRLTLYEAAYGFSRLRTYAHFFIPWLTLLLIGVIVMEILRKQRFFMLSVILCAFGLGITLTAVNVDGFIAKQNIQRAMQGEALDPSYLFQLSNDAVPVLAREFGITDLMPEVRAAIGANLSCRLTEIRTGKESTWQSFHLSNWMAEQTLLKMENDLKNYPVIENDGRWVVKINGLVQDCGITLKF